MPSPRNYLLKPGLAAAFALAMPLYANADLLPPPNELSVIEYNDFVVSSLELLEKCKDDPRCQSASANLDKIGGGGGAIKDQPVILAAASGAPTKSNSSALGELGDGSFRAPTGDGEAFAMGAGNEPELSFAGGRIGSWDVQVGALTDWLSGNDLVFMANNKQSRNSANQRLQAGARVYDNVDASQGCWERSNGLNYSGCKVDGNGNAADNPIFSQSLNDYLYDTAQRDWAKSLDLRLANNTAGGESGWITNQFEPNAAAAPIPVPAPGTLLLMGAGLLLLRKLQHRRR
jgi:hypothetical protein